MSQALRPPEALIGRQLNFTTAELTDLLRWPEAFDQSEAFSFRLWQRFGIEELRAEDRIARVAVPRIPCKEVPRVGPVDEEAVRLAYGWRGTDADTTTERDRERLR
jgi:hypothetical protein